VNVLPGFHKVSINLNAPHRKFPAQRPPTGLAPPLPPPSQLKPLGLAPPLPPPPALAPSAVPRASALPQLKTSAHERRAVHPPSLLPTRIPVRRASAPWAGGAALGVVDLLHHADHAVS